MRCHRPMHDDLMDSPSTPSSDCQAFQTLASPRNRTPSEEELSSLNDEYISDASTSSEYVVEYAVLLPDSFVVLD